MTVSLRWYQQNAVDAVLNTDLKNPVLGLPTGCHAAGHPILMFDGSIKRVEDVRVGDVLMGDDGTPRTVLMLRGGESEMIRFDLNNGVSFVVNDDHFLPIVRTRSGRDYPSQNEKTEILRAKSLFGRSKWWWHTHKIALSDGVEWATGHQPIPPYVMGMLIGDGSYKQTCITNMDREVINEFVMYVWSLGLDVNVRQKPNNRAYTVYATGGGVVENRVRTFLKEIGVYHQIAQNKTLPRQYVIASRKDRLEFLAGLLDTDGHYDAGGYEFSTVSEALSDDFIFLCRSLGFKARKFDKYVNGKRYFRIHV